MASLKEFIASIKAEPLLYKHYSDLNNTHIKKQREKWKNLAQKYKFLSGDMAKEKWQQLLADYLKFLRQGGEFCYAQNMQFMQAHLLCTDLSETSLSDSDIDELELQKAVQSDDVLEDNKLERDSVKKRKFFSLVDTTFPNIAVENSHNLSNFSSLELIFLGYAKVLQRMPLSLQLQTKRKIAVVMDEAELKLADMK